MGQQLKSLRCMEKQNKTQQGFSKDSLSETKQAMAFLHKGNASYCVCLDLSNCWIKHPWEIIS